MKEKEVIPVNNRIDDVVDGFKKRCFSKPIQLQLVQFIGHSLDNKGSIDKRVNQENEYYVVEHWKAINVATQEFGDYVVPNVLGHRYDDNIDLTEETSYYDRPVGQYPDNEWEVNLLQDTYQEYLDNQRNIMQPDFHLSAIVIKHKLRMARLDILIKSEINPKLKAGYVMHFIQKETPSMLGKRKYEEWCKANPLLFTKLIDNVYNVNHYVSA